MPLAQTHVCLPLPPLPFPPVCMPYMLHCLCHYFLPHEQEKRGDRDRRWTGTGQEGQDLETGRKGGGGKRIYLHSLSIIIFLFLFLSCLCLGLYLIVCLHSVYPHIPLHCLCPLFYHHTHLSPCLLFSLLPTTLTLHITLPSACLPPHTASLPFMPAFCTFLPFTPPTTCLPAHTHCHLYFPHHTYLPAYLLLHTFLCTHHVCLSSAPLPPSPLPPLYLPHATTATVPTPYSPPTACPPTRHLPLHTTSHSPHHPYHLPTTTASLFCQHIVRRVAGIWHFGTVGLVNTGVCTLWRFGGFVAGTVGVRARGVAQHLPAVHATTAYALPRGTPCLLTTKPSFHTVPHLAPAGAHAACPRFRFGGLLAWLPSTTNRRRQAAF